ncbi:DUF2975 domain-containing protein [Telluribacter sp.]|jgi:hypothetical protein|uniref:DUF2975 domain-containing protein n=1 Tax=Telluribacter sp. TaxID=1978767 RepID=UPI002E0EFF7C|nr:DUF2975 domain-containing protein [Telluribacter sp.]
MRTEQILNILRVVAWIVFIGAIGQATVAAVMIIAFSLSESLPDLPAPHVGVLLLLASSTLTVHVLYAQLWLKIKDLLSEINLSSPFTITVANKLLAISYVMLSIWFISFINMNFNHYLNKRMPEVVNAMGEIGKDLIAFNINGAYLLAAGIVYIIAQVFRRGVELQQENDLTI